MANVNAGRKRDAKGRLLPKDGASKTAEQAPKRPQAKLPVNKKMTDALVMLVNTGWQVSPWRADALTEIEAEALSRSLLRAAQSNPYLGNLINKLTTATAEAQLVGCIGAIVVTRLAQRAIVPPLLEIPAQTLIAGLAGAEVTDDGLAAGAARSPAGPDRDRQDDAPGAAPPPSPVGGNAEGEIGYASMAEFQADQAGQRNGHGPAGPGWGDPLDTATPTGGAS